MAVLGLHMDLVQDDSDDMISFLFLHDLLLEKFGILVPQRVAQVGGFASVDSPMDLQSLSELFRKLHEEVRLAVVMPTDCPIYPISYDVSI